MDRIWIYNQKLNAYQPSTTDPLSTFPTIVNIKERKAYCRVHHCWEPIVSFSSNVLKTACGKSYLGPFSYEGKIFPYGYEISKRPNSYHIKVMSQLVSVKKRRLINYVFEINLANKRIYKNDIPVIEEKDIRDLLCNEITEKILDEIGELYKARYGIKPTISSIYTGFDVILGYLLCPFNVNFYKISKHWGLNPFDSDFTSLSSGDTPNAENEMFECMNIQPTKTIRKLYQKNPFTIIPYAAVKDLGFTDVNLLQKSTSKDFYIFFSFYNISFADGEINYHIRNALHTFITDMLALSNQKTVWNSLNRTIEFFVKKQFTEMIITDGIYMYQGCSAHLTDREKKEIMKEGFNSYTHDFLIRRNNGLFAERNVADNLNQMTYENVQFNLEQKFLDLEYKCGDDYYINKDTSEKIEIPDEDRWCFYVARDSYTLKQIGSQMHNCVGWGYRQAIMDRRATIVYAMYKSLYKICIEVTPSFTIRQAFGPCNSQLEGAAFDAYCEWCKEKKIQRKNVFKRLIAP